MTEIKVKDVDLKYMGSSIKCKRYEFVGVLDSYGRNTTFTIAKQSDANQVTDPVTGMMKWTGGAFYDMQINKYVEDEIFEKITPQEAYDLYNK